MCARLALLLCFFVFAVAYADPNPDEEAFLNVPGAISVTEHVMDQFLTVSELPKGILQWLKSSNFVSEDGILPSEILGFTFDLNKDGKDEYFIYDRMGSGSGGSSYEVFSEIDHHWRSIGGFQGSLHMFPMKKGWPRLVSIGRGGGGCWKKCYMEFQKGAYKELFCEHYERGIITWERLARK